VIYVGEISNKLSKTRFWKEKLVENVVTLGSFLFNSGMISFHLWMFKNNTYITKQCSHVGFPFFVMGSHLG
jgi:hypothetical protein